MAASGNLYCTGDPDRAPVRCAGDAAYAHTAPEIAFAALTALASGVRPVDVDLSMQETVLVANMGGAGRWFRSRAQARRAGANIGRTREIWPTRDGWVSFGLRGGKARIPSLQTISRLIDDPVLTERDWTTWDVLSASDEDVDAVQKVVGEWFARHSTAELYEYACDTNLMLAPGELTPRAVRICTTRGPGLLRRRRRPDQVGPRHNLVLASTGAPIRTR